MKTLRDSVYSTLRLIARHVEGFYPPLAVFFTVSFAIALVATVGFGLIAHAVDEGLTQSFDEYVLRWLFAHRTPALDNLMLDFTTLGSSTVMIVMTFVAATILWQTQHRGSVAILFIGNGGALILNWVLKAIFARPRPVVVAWLTQVHTTSFPSGHAMGSLICYGSIAYVTGRLAPEPRLRKTTWIGAGVIILAIGISRMYLGVHYPSDVVAGYIAGLAWLTFLPWSVAAIKFFARHRRMEAPRI